MPQVASQLLIGAFTFCVVSLLTEGRTRYDQYKAYEYSPRSISHMNLIHQIQEAYSMNDDLTFWKMAAGPNKSGTFMVSPSAHGRLIRFLRTRHMPLRKISNNVQRLIDRESFQNRLMRMKNLFRSSSSREPHTYYMRYNEMVNWMQTTARNCIRPLKCSVISIGRSHQLRHLYVMKISNGKRRQKFWIDAGIHPREWIAPSTALYLIKKLTDYDDEAKAMLDKFEFHILPLMNPDGYEYTHTNLRFWRKNLVPSNYYCTGVDLNRNFGFHWGGSGSSNNPCADNYRGRRPFSEPETMRVRNYLKRNNRTMLAYFTLHSYGQYILIPFGHRREFYPLNKIELMNVGESISRKIELFSGRRYDVGSAADLLYEASGGSTDYISAILNVPYTYTFELPDTGRYAFFLPSQYIIHIGKEMWIALKEFCSKV